MGYGIFYAYFYLVEQYVYGALGIVRFGQIKHRHCHINDICAIFGKSNE